MTKRLIIAIDCDDVLVDTVHDILNFYNKKYGTDIDETDYYDDIRPERLGVATLHEAIDRFNERLMMQEHHDIPPTTEAIETVRRLAVNHELHLVTGRQQVFESATTRMVERYFAGCFTTIEHTNYYTVDKKAHKRTKGEVCRSLNVDVMVDDFLDHIENALDAGVPHGIVFGNFDWGKRRPLPKGAVRCLDWRSVEKEINRIAVTR